MASKLFKQEAGGLKLAQIREAVSGAVQGLEEKRAQAILEAQNRGESPTKFARVHIGSVLTDPRDKGVSLLISYSDHDKDTPLMIERIIEERQFLQHRDVYLL
jgi:hypothetical protein